MRNRGPRRQFEVRPLDRCYRMDTTQLTIAVLMYFVLPVWLAAGFADYLCHRASNIATTSGPKESMLHLLQFAEMAVAVLAALFLEINALVLLIMLVCFVLHEATALWDLSYASTRREVTPIEQHVHSFLEMMPLMPRTISLAAFATLAAEVADKVLANPVIEDVVSVTVAQDSPATEVTA